MKYFMYLPFFLFGLSTAPYVFTKLLKPLEKHWRLQGISIAIFLDDGWGTVQGREDYLAGEVGEKLFNSTLMNKLIRIE